MRPVDAQPDDYVFQVERKPLDDRDVLRRFIRPVAQELGLYFKGFGWRTFRRLHVTAIQDGSEAVNVFEAMAQAGHTRPETTMRYTLLQSDRRDSAVLRLQEKWIPAKCAGMRECGNKKLN
ncbi:MAG TPA: hypothetical protein VN736_10300 [Candidatus Limnocylindrales bacterium]|nr:hypothetical protein [Candidatus Limnocylindrales bacterium]